MASVQNYIKSSLRVVVAQICHNMGWHAIQTTPLDLLVDILHRYLEELGRTAHRYSEQFGRTNPNLDDFGLAFKDIGIPLGELEDYVNNVEPVPFVQEIAKIPIPRSSNFQFPKPGSREVLNRPEWIDEHLPPMYPEAEDDDISASPTSTGEGFLRKNGSSTVDGSDLSPLGGVKRPLDLSGTSGLSFKRSRLYVEDEGCPMREGISVSMTLTGELTPIREGRLPEAKAPIFFDDGRPSSPSPESSVGDQNGDGASKKDGKKESVKDDKGKSKNKKDKGKILKKKTGKKDKTSKTGNKKTKDKDKAKDGSKEKKIKLVPTMKLTNIERGPDGKFKKVKTSKSKISKAKVSPLKPPLSKSKVKDDKSPGIKTEKKRKRPSSLQHSTTPLLLSPKFPKSPKSGSSSTTNVRPPKSPKHSSPLLQLESLLNKGRDIDGASSPELLLSVKSELSDNNFSGENSPERLVIDDNPETAEKQEREFRLAALNDSIDAVIQKGLEETEKAHNESSKSYHETIEDVIRQGVLETTVKIEPRDVYDFTDDDEISPPVTPATPELVMSLSPAKKKPRRDSSSGEVGKKVRDKIKEKIKQKSREPKLKSKSLVTKIKTEAVEILDEKRPNTPESRLSEPDSGGVSFQTPYPRMLNQYPHLPYFPLTQIPQVPPALLPYPTPSIPPLPLQFQSHVPPNMPMPPMGFYVRNPRPDPGNLRISEPPLSHSQNLPLPLVDCERGEEPVVEKVKQEQVEEPVMDKPKSKREKKEKIKDKDGDVDGEKDGDKLKVKKKKEKGKEKKKTSDGSDLDKPASKNKNNKDKPVKNKDKSKKADKDKKKKEEKVKDDTAIPRITLKLGGNVAASEGTKMNVCRVIKPMAPRETPQFSDSSSPVTDIISTTPKSHPKPQSKVNPVPLPPKSVAGPSASAPARTVITETVGTIIDDQGNKIWICPACTRPDDGSPMIGCDECDDWYHWVCVGIVVPPKDEENWYCSRCIVKKQGVQKKKKKKHRKDKAQV